MIYYIIVNVVLGIALGATSHVRGGVFAVVTLASIGSIIWTIATFGLMYGLLVVLEIFVGVVISSFLMFSGKFK